MDGLGNMWILMGLGLGQQGLANSQLRQQGSDQMIQPSWQNLAHVTPRLAPLSLVNNGVGLLPKDLLYELVKEQDIPDKVRTTVSAYHESRTKPPSSQPQQAQWWNRIAVNAFVRPV